MDHYRLFINGEFVDAANGATFESLDPGTGKPLATVARAGLPEVDAAVSAARAAFDSGVWSRRTPTDRAEVLLELADLIQAQLPRLALLEAQDSGGVLARTSSDIYQAARFIRAMANHAAQHFPWTEEIPNRNAPFHSHNYTRREPVGVVAAIIPWNFPFLMAAWKLGMALATGNTVVLKPAPDTSLSALALGEILRQSRLPAGVVNVLAAPGIEVPEALCLHKGVDKIAFTGSTTTGRRVMEMAARGIKRVSVELGGKSANIILRDADMEMALDGAVFGNFLHSGQVCTSGSRLLVPEEMKDTLLTGLVARIRELRVGHQLDPRTRIGPLCNEKQRATVERYIEVGRKEGARVVTGGGRAVVEGFDGGYFVQPTVFADVRNDMTLAREEIFGPVLSVLTYRTEEEAVALANDSDYGLAGGVWSRDLSRAEKVAAAMRTGTVWINDYHVFHDHAPFGGYGQSGIGKELGHHGLLEYTNTKHIHVGTEGDPDNKLGHKLVVKRGRTHAYEYEPTTRIISGPGCVARLHSEAAALGKKRILLISDAGLVAAGTVERVRQVLGDRVAAVFTEVPQDSGLEVIDAAAALGRQHNVDAVLSVGGGSVMDTAKGVCVALTGNIRAIQALGIQALTGPQITHLCVPTTAGTGSEVTNVAVIKNHKLKVKGYIVDRFVVPDVAFLDPLLTLGLPARLTAATGLDALTHAIEAYTSRMANPMTDAQALHAVRLIGQNLRTAVKDPQNVEARTHMQSAATLAGWAISSANVGLVHGMSHALGARYGVPHGIGNGILLPHVMVFNTEAAHAVPRLRDVAVALGVDISGMDEKTAALAAAKRVAALLVELDHPTTLREVGVPAEGIKETARSAFVDPANMTSARRVNTPKEIELLYTQAMG